MTIPTANLGFSTTANTQKVSRSVYNIEQQPEITILPQKLEVVIPPELQQIASKFQRQVRDFRPWQARIKCRQVIATMTDNRKWQCRRFARQFTHFLVVDRCSNHLANLLSSSTSSKILNLALEFRRYLLEFHRCNYFRFWRPYRYFRLSVTVVLTYRNYFPPIRGLIPQICRWNFKCAFHSFRYISIGPIFPFQPPFPIVGHYCNRLDTLPASLPWSNAVGLMAYVVVSEISLLPVSWLPSWIFDTR